MIPITVWIGVGCASDPGDDRRQAVPWFAADAEEVRLDPGSLGVLKFFDGCAHLRTANLDNLIVFADFLDVAVFEDHLVFDQGAEMERRIDSGSEVITEVINGRAVLDPELPKRWPETCEELYEPGETPIVMVRSLRQIASEEGG